MLTHTVIKSVPVSPPNDSKAKDIIRPEITPLDLNPVEGKLESEESKEQLSPSLIAPINPIQDTEVKVQGPPTEIVSPGQQVPPQMTHRKSSSSLTLTASLLFLLRRLFVSTKLPEGVTRIEWKCRCGHISYDDFPLSPEIVKPLEDDLRYSKILRRVEITNKRPSLLYEWMLSLQNAVISPFWQHISSDSSNPGSSSSGPLDSSSVDSQSSASGSNLQTLLDDSGDIGTARLSRGKQRKLALNRKPVEGNRKRFIHVCVDVGRVKCLEVIEIDVQDLSRPKIKCDQELFRRLKAIHEKQWRRGYGLFLKLRAIRFVEVSVLLNCHAVLQAVLKK